MRERKGEKGRQLTFFSFSTLDVGELIRDKGRGEAIGYREKTQIHSGNEELWLEQ